MSARAVRLTEADIDNALADGHLETVYQPVVRLSDREILRHEVFVRWDHPALGSLPPGAFLSFFEALGRMGDLTRYVLRRALSDRAALPAGVAKGLSLNLSPSDLQDESLAADVLALVNEFDLQAADLTLECPLLTEDEQSDDLADRLQALAETGCGMALEIRSRGTDLSSRFDPFPFSEIKVGGATILRHARQARGGPGMAALSDLLAFARSQGATMIAVGVENETAVKSLIGLGFDAGQGNALGRAGTFSVEIDAAEETPSATVTAAEELVEARKAAAERARQSRLAAAKRAALRRFQAADEARRLADQTSAAATGKPAEADADAVPSEEASRHARQLQARLETNFSDLEDEGEAAARLNGRDTVNGPLGIGITAGFDRGLRLDGYRTPLVAPGPAPLDPPTLRAGAVAFGHEAAPSLVGKGQTSGIAALLSELPVQWRERDLPPPPPAPLASTGPSDEEIAPRAAADLLDDAVAEVPTLPTDPFGAGNDGTPSLPVRTDDMPLVATDKVREDGPSLPVADWLPEWMPYVLRRKYRVRITHFWPRSFRRAYRRFKAHRAEAEADYL